MKYRAINCRLQVIATGILLFRKAAFVMVLIVLSFHTVHAQENVKIRRSEFKLKSEGFRDAWNNIKEGNKAFVMGKGMYWTARENYLKASTYNELNPELNYKLGACYVMTDDKFKAIQYLKTAFRMKPGVSKDIHFLLGRAYHLVLNFDTAIMEYTIYKSSLHGKELRMKGASIDKLIKECNNGKELIKSPLRVIVTDLGPQVNSEYDDYNSVITPDDSLMYFTSRRKLNRKSKVIMIDYKYPEDVYVAHIDSGHWTGAKNLGKPINTEHNDAAVAVSDGGKKLYVYNGYEHGGDILVSRQRKGHWTKPRKISGKLRSKAHESSFFIAPDSSAVYFVSNMTKNNIGGKDIYMCKLKENGKWSRPVNLGDVINTPYDEEGVSLSKDGKTLYFSSKGHNTMGGYDVFKSQMDSTGKWTTPVNMGYPINSPDDELFYYEAPDNQRFGYYSAVRDGGLGGKDIYKVTFLGEAKEAVMTTDEQLYAWPYQKAPSIFLSMPAYITIDSSIVLQGRITDAKTQAPWILMTCC